MKRITTTIKQPYLNEIVAGTKKFEYREMKAYWTDKLRNITVPFELRLINGMRKRAPEATLLIDDIDVHEGVYALHIAEVLSTKNLK